ncbi:hypothetical protein [Streptomyces sp. NPDC050564]|uniref:hypothetical protein n=1 Tax=Streptomyces sp. NPDC050564 TaxID=3365631 RepID=UPI0037B3F157
MHLMSQAGTLILVMSVAVLAPLPAYGTGRRLLLPLVVFGILSGILVGRDALGRAGEGAAHRRGSGLGPARLGVVSERPRRPWLSRVIARPCAATGQFAVRLVVLLVHGLPVCALDPRDLLRRDRCTLTGPLRPPVR